jgi:hypothetical protein
MLFRIGFGASAVGIVAIFAAAILVGSGPLHTVLNTIGIVLIPAGVLLNGVVMVTGFRQYSRLKNGLLTAGAQGTAEVLMINSSRVLKDTQLCVLQVWVTPADGTLAFESTLRITVPLVATPRAGDLIEVRYDPANPTQLIPAG